MRAAAWVGVGAFSLFALLPACGETSDPVGDTGTTDAGSQTGGDASVPAGRDAGQGGGPGPNDAATQSDAGAATEDASAGDGDGDPQPEPSSGCGKQPPQNGERSVTVSGVAEPRTYLLDVPPNYDPDKAYPLVFGFHGATSSAMAFRSAFYGNLPAVAGKDAILVHGQAMSINGSTAWNHDSDLAYFDAVLADVESVLCVDSARVFATGHSSGGFYTNRLGCSRGDKLRAIAPLAAGGPGFGPFAPNCVGQVAVWIEHGEVDEVVYISMGEGSRDFWRAQNHCQDVSAPTSPAGCVAYTGCDDGYPVHWCVSSGGHEPRPGFTAAGAWAFFQMF